MASKELGEEPRSWGYSPAKIRDYGLRKVNLGDTTQASLVARLKRGGPILVSGKFAAAQVREKWGHIVLVIGVSGSNKVVYLDPFLIGWKAIQSNHYTYLSVTDFFGRLRKDDNKMIADGTFVQAEAFPNPTDYQDLWHGAWGGE
jgi:hypothetical protein